MIVVESGQEFSLTATLHNRKRRPANAEQHEIILYTPDNSPYITVTTPEHVATGVYRATFKFPDDAPEGMWKIQWTAIVQGWPVTEVTEIDVQLLPRESMRALETNMYVKYGAISFFNNSLVVKSLEQNVLVDCGEHQEHLPENLTAIVLTHAHIGSAFGLKDKKLSIPVYVNKFTNKALPKGDFPFRRKIFWKKRFMVNAVPVTPVPVVHSVRAPTTGLLFELAGRRIGYFPHVLDIPNKVVLNQLDLYIGDGTSLDEDLVRQTGGKKYGHASIRTQLSWLQQAKVKRAVFINLGKWAKSPIIVREVFKLLSLEFGMKAVVANNNYRILLTDKIMLQKRLPRIGTLEDILSYCKEPVSLESGYTAIIDGIAQHGKTEGSVELSRMKKGMPVFIDISKILPLEIVKRLQEKFSVSLTSDRSLAIVVDARVQEKKEKPEERSEL